MAWAYRTGSYADDGAGWLDAATPASKTVTFGAAVSSGDLLVLNVFSLAQSGTNPSFSVSDSVNGSWSSSTVTNSFPVAGFNCRHSIFSFPNSGAGTPVITVTVTTSAGLLNGGMQCAAYSGIITASPVDTTSGATGTGSPTSSGNTGATTGANELVVGGYVDTGDGTTLGAGSGFTSRGKHDVDTHAWQGLFEDEDSGSSGTAQSTSTTHTGVSAGWSQLCVVYKIVAVAGSSPVAILEKPMQNTQGLVVLTAVRQATPW